MEGFDLFSLKSWDLNLNVLNTITLKSREGRLLGDTELLKKLHPSNRGGIFMLSCVHNVHNTCQYAVYRSSQLQQPSVLPPSTDDSWVAELQGEFGWSKFCFSSHCLGRHHKSVYYWSWEMHFSANIIDYFLEHPAKVKAAMNEPQTTAKKTQQRQS